MNAEPEKPRFSLKKRDKLVLKQQFDDVRRRGVKYGSPGLAVVIAPFEQLECGVICSRKYSLSAVDRNRARRLLWESFRLLKPRIAACRIVLIPRRNFKGYSLHQAMRDLSQALNQCGVLSEEK